MALMLVRWLNPACMLGVGVIGAIDYWTGPELSVTLFYLLPISLAAWCSGYRSGLVMAFLAAVTWTTVDVLTREYSQPLIACWNGLVGVAAFATVSLLCSRTRTLTEALRQRVLEKADALAVQTDRYEVTRDALDQTKHQFRILVEGVSDLAVFMLDPAGNIQSWNEGAQILTGYEPAETLGKSFACLWPPEVAVRGLALETLQRAHRDGVWNGEGWCVRGDGSRFWAAWVLTVLRNRDGNVRGLSEMIHDVTARKRLEDRVLANEEAERQRIGHELHDVVGQDLTAVALLSKELEERLSSTRPTDSQLATRITRFAQLAMDDVRRLSAGLCALRLETGGLQAALEQLALDTEQVFNVGCRLECCDANLPRYPLVDLHLYRIAQEAVTNAVRHAEAFEIRIRLNLDDGHLTLRIEDDGVGLPIGSLDGSADASGLGISIMQYRARTVGGHLAFERLSPRGTAVFCTVPGEAFAQAWQFRDATKPPGD